MSKFFKLKFICIATIASSLHAEEKQWVWLNGKLTQIEVEQKTQQTDLEKDIEWKLIDGKLTKVEKSKQKKGNTSGSQLPIDIPNSQDQGLQTNQYTRAKDITKSYESPEISSPLTENFRESVQESLSSKDRQVSLPKRVIRDPYSKLSASELNAWGKELMQTKNWLNYHHKRLKGETNPSQSFLIGYQKILNEWNSDFANYQKALKKAEK